MTDQLNIFDEPRFDGASYDPIFDDERLGKQIKEIYTLMIDGRYRTLAEIERGTGYPQASISARLRDFRKKRFGSHVLNKRRRGEAKNGLWEYQLTTK